MAAYDEVLLYNSVICRLCAAENVEGIFIYDNENDYDFKSLINRFLPIKVEDDGKLPRTICPGCNIQLESTIQFFDLLAEGQKKIRELWKLEVTARKRLEKEKQILVETLEGNPKISLVTDVDENIQEDDIFIKILPDGNMFGSEHEMTLRIEGLDKPKRKRGRPKKVKAVPEVIEPEPNDALVESNNLLKEIDDEIDYDEHGRKRRRRKVPQRFMEAVQGKELDRILREEGAIDGNESDETIEEEQFATVELPKELDVGALDENAGEIIGHLETPDGNIAEQIIAPIMGRLNKRRRITRFVCDFCGQAFKDRTRYVRHRMAHKGMKFQCSHETCMKKFSSKNKLKLHQKTTGHEGEDLIEDELEDFKSKKLMKPRLSCANCTKSFVSMNVLTKHIANEHPEVAVLEAAGAAEAAALQEDMMLEEEGEVVEGEDGKRVRGRPGKPGGKNHACDECSRTFNHPSSLMYHKESVHNDGRRFVCSKCGKSFTHKQLLQRHQMVHSDTRPFPCPDCGLRFKTKSNLFNHRVVHTGEKKFSCQICTQQFAHKTSLTLHLRWHKGHRPFKCHVCQKCFTQNGNLREHLRIHTNTKPYGCEYCGKFFTTSSQHKLHVKRHTGDRPWKCSHCDRCFLHKDTWRTHERRHTGEKPFQCSYCMRGFAEHWSLKKHVRLHTGERPYKCQVCGKEFADCSNLTKHRRVHQGLQGATPKMENSVWSIIKSHLIEDMTQQPEQEVQQIIYVTYQDGEEGKTLHLVDGGQDGGQDGAGEEITIEENKELLQMAAMPEPPQPMIERLDTPPTLQTHVGVTDEEGNPVQLTMADGRVIDLVSMDTESHVVQVRTAEGLGVLVPLPRGQEITEVDLVERIQQAVLDELRKPKFHKSVLLPKVHRNPDGDEGTHTIVGQVLTEDMLSAAHIISEDEAGMTLDEHKPLVTEFEMDDPYKKLNEFLATQQC